MTIAPFIKKPGEKFSFAFDFKGKLPIGRNVYLVSAALSAVDASDNSDASSAVLQSATGTVVGLEVWVPVKGGTNAKDYTITCAATLSEGSIVINTETMQVRA